MREAVEFYTEVLDFTLMEGDSVDDGVVDLLNGGAQIQVSIFEGIFGIAINIQVEEVDELFQKYVDRGLAVPNDPNSPVHQGPIDQTWGFREFYVNDPSGNTLRFRKLIDN